MIAYTRHLSFQSKRFVFSFLVATLLLGVIVSLSGSAPPSAWAAVTPPTLYGEVAAYPPPPGSLVVTATGPPCTTYSFSVTTTASGPYNGSFTATGTFALQPITPDPLAPNITHRVISWTETFTIDQPVSALPPQPVAHVITGTKQLDPTANDSIVNVAQCSGTLINPSPVVTTYQATITGAEGTFTDSGVAQSGIIDMPFNAGAASFFENFSSNQATTTPAGDGDGDGVPDSQDACPNTPPNTTVNAAGCPVGACFPPPTSMISWWPGDGNTNDIQDGNNGTLQGGATFSSGEVGQAFNFDGSTGHVFIGNPANLKLTNAITIDAWVNPTGLPNPQGDGLAAIVTKWAQVFQDTPSSDSYGLWLINNNGTIRLFSALHQPGGNEPHIEGGVIQPNVFTHVAMTFDSTTGLYVLYVNGQQVASRVFDQLPIFATDHNVLIGREDSYVIRPFSGLIDEVEIFSRALSPAEINAIYLADGSGKCKALDADDDGVPDDSDNCPTTANPNQEDADGDGVGDACDACPGDAANDADGDGVCGNVDNCPTSANADQADTDGDGKGDACDACPGDAANDADGDGVCGNLDNCPTVYNPDQRDTNGDGVGDACAPFQFPNGGQFVIGDLVNQAGGVTVNFWGSQWSKNNPMSGGAGPKGFKGFESGNALPTCGSTWMSQPGNSSNPPATIPQYMAVIVSSSITQNGSVISGNIQRILVVKTNPGYDGNPGHAGTGQVVAIICGAPVQSTRFGYQYSPLSLASLSGFEWLAGISNPSPTLSGTLNWRP
jgi:concanavalin A-like lectin/glucanase superfamily protein/thrombospondin type 3 repeat protein